MDNVKLVTMANQIAGFFAAQRGDAARAAADHIVANWDPRMRAGLAAHVAAGGEGLSEVARAAADLVAATSR
ncbi:MAG: formate dehydrogenase subunit delta [Siculibacillus sp.]|nr:formate dehydrogenase subunit delta [Siculibacillus sp.]